MPKSPTVAVGAFLQHYPKAATVVTVKAKDKENAMAVAWHTALSFAPPLYGVAVSSKRFSYGLILDAREFAVNFMPIESRKLIAAVGRTSGREFNKFEKFHITKEKPVKIAAPILEEAYVAYECRLVSHHTCGDHEWFVGEVVAVHYKQDTLDDKGTLNLDKVRPAMYLGEDLYAELGKIKLYHLGREEALAQD